MRVDDRSAGADLGAAAKADAAERAKRHHENPACFRANDLRRNSAPQPGDEPAMISNRETALQALHFDKKTDDGGDTAMNREVWQPIDFIDNGADHHRPAPSVPSNSAARSSAFPFKL
jgi:hypothetical protein